MKVKVQNENTISAFLNVRGEWLLSEGNTIIVIREVQYTHTKPEPEPEEEHEPLPPNTSIFKRKRDKKKEKPQDEWHITKLVAEAYNEDGKFVGTYNEDWCERVIKAQDDMYGTFNIYNLRKRWESIVMQKDAMLEHEAKMKAKAEEEKEPSTFAELGAKVFNESKEENK